MRLKLGRSLGNRLNAGVASVVLLAGGAGTVCWTRSASAQVEELFSRHLRVLRPQGTYAPSLIKLNPPAGDEWKVVEFAEQGLRLKVPGNAKVETAAKESRVLEVALPSDGAFLRPVLRVDAYKTQPGEPTEVDPDYTEEYAEAYPDAAFKGKFTVSDQGTLVIGKQKTRLAMIGGTYKQGAAGAYRLQCAYLSPQHQLFFTFDCADQDWAKHEDTVGQILLSLEPTGRKGK